MTDTTQTNEAVSAELAALAEAINKEEATEEHVVGMADDREKVHLALKEQITEILPQGTPASATDDATVPPPSAAPATVKKGLVGTKSYLDNVDDATVAKVNGYVARVFQNGLQATLKEVVEQDPFVLDVFHDALTDKLYKELKARGLVK